MYLGSLAGVLGAAVVHGRLGVVTRGGGDSLAAMGCIGVVSVVGSRLLPAVALLASRGR